MFTVRKRIKKFVYTLFELQNSFMGIEVSGSLILPFVSFICFVNVPHAVSVNVYMVF